MEAEIISGNPAPKLADLNNKVIQKLYELVDSLESTSEPDMVRACVESLAKLNSSLKNSGILPQEESDEERREREEKETIMEAMTL